MTVGAAMRRGNRTGALGQHLMRIAAAGLIAFGLALSSSPETSRAQEAGAPDNTSALLLDITTGTLLSSRNPTVRYQPGSSAKLMTAAVVFDALAAGELTEETAFTVSEHAWRSGGAPARVTTMFARLGSEVPVIDLLRGLVIQNANDAAIVLAEGLAGSEDAFAARMNEKAAEIGLTGSRFANPTGYETSESYVTARDMARLADYVLTRHGDRYALFSAPDFTWNGIFQRNKNPLIGEVAGVDGLVAGFAEGAGYNAVASAERSGRRLIGIVAGHADADKREEALRRLFDSLEKDFEDVVLFSAGDTVTEARVFGGSVGAVPLVVREDVEILLPRGDRHAYRLRAIYRGPLPAPVQPGTEVGELRVLKDSDIVYRAPLLTGSAAEAGTVTSRAADVVKETLFGWWLDE